MGRFYIQIIKGRDKSGCQANATDKVYDITKKVRSGKPDVSAGRSKGESKDFQLRDG